MADLIEALHNLARERARGGPSPLVALRRFPARPGARISHLGISQRLAQAWITVTGEPFRPHQSLALSALRRGEPLALVGGGAARQTLHLLALELLRSEAPATAILLAPDERAAAAHRAELERLVRALGEPVRVGLAQGDDARAAMSAHLVVVTPQALHERLLRHHQRAWSALWARLRLITVADAHGYAGVGAAHLSWLLVRARRLAGGGRQPQLAATLAPVAAPDEALGLIAGEPWRVFPADDGPAPAAALALWRPGGERARELAALALGLSRGGVGVHVTCEPIEVRHIEALVGPDVAAVGVGPSPLPAQVQILAGATMAASHLRQCLDGAQLTVVLLGDDPAERTLARLAARDSEQITLLDDPPPAWVVAPGNAYVSAHHLICAAAERPLSGEEVSGWGAESLVARLEEHRQLVRLPEPVWQPLPDGGDVYAGFDLRSAGTAPALVCDEQGARLSTLDVAAFDRWGFSGAALPPLRGGLRVVARDDGELELKARPAEQRRTIPLRRCTVRVRDRREQRLVGGREVGWGRVVLDEEVYGYREVAGANAPAERALNPPLSSSLAAPACWIDLPSGISASGQLAGWCLVAALPLRSLGAVADLVPAYDAEARRVYFVDAQPGGNGVSAWLFTSLEQLLPSAYDVALDCRGDQLLEPLARADMDWLLGLLAEERGSARQKPEGRAAPPPPEEAIPVPPPVRLEPRTVPPPARPEPPRARLRGEEVLPPVAPPAPQGAPPVREEPPLRGRPPEEELLPPVAPPAPPPARPAAPAARDEPPLRGRPPEEELLPPVAPPVPQVAPPVREEPPLRGRPPEEELLPPVAPPAPPPARPAAPPVREGTPRGRATEKPPREEPPRGKATEKPPRGRQREERAAPPQRKKSSREERQVRGSPASAGPSATPAARSEPPREVPVEPPRSGRQAAPAQPPLPLDPEPPARPALRPSEPVTPPEPLPDAAAMVARLRRIREQRERQDPAPRQQARPADPAEPRFHSGDRIVCTPYGRGEVVESRLEGERELLVVDFADHGELTIDAAVSAARLDEAAARHPNEDNDF